MEVIHRSLLEFSLEELPPSADIIRATLFLYTLDPQDALGPSWPEGCHIKESGSNAVYLRRITSVREEYSVTWRNQPTVTREHEILIPDNTEPCQGYAIGITELVADQVECTGQRIGLSFQLRIEEPYRRMVYASSDFPDASKWPSLEIRYRE